MAVQSNGNQAQSAQAVAITIFGEGPGVMVRRNANGAVMGRRISFQGEFPAGDVRKALKERGLKGKALTKEVDKVLRGDSTLPWAMFEATVSAARSKGFVPVVSDLNKAGTRLTAKLEKPTVVYGKTEVQAIAKQTLKPADMIEMLAEQKLSKEDIALLAMLAEQSTTETKTTGTVEVQAEVKAAAATK
jgi:hypothetical protein